LAILDKILFWGFLILSTISLIWSGFAFYKSLKSAKYNDEGLRMFFWAVGGLLGLIIAGVGIVYFLIPIITYYTAE
jgi:hypothetical protein